MAAQVQDIVVHEPLDQVVEPLRARWHQLVPLLAALDPDEAEAISAPLGMALECLDEALLRVGRLMPLTENGEDAKQHALVLRVEPGVGADS